jgi:hypothetical protein
VRYAGFRRPHRKKKKNSSVSDVVEFVISKTTGYMFGNGVLVFL